MKIPGDDHSCGCQSRVSPYYHRSHCARDYAKLRELGDLLMELQAAKDDGYLPGLAYLDNARGIDLIAEKPLNYPQERPSPFSLSSIQPLYRSRWGGRSLIFITICEQCMYRGLWQRSYSQVLSKDLFGLSLSKGTASPYSLETCAGITDTVGGRADGYQIEPVHGGVCLSLPTLIECNKIPDNRSEISTPEAAHYHSHLKSIAPEIPELDEKAQILLLQGHDILRVHKVRKRVNGPHNAPFAFKLDLGWVLVGDVCLGSSHMPRVQCFKTSVLEDGRPSIFTPCENRIHLKEMANNKGFLIPSKCEHEYGPDTRKFVERDFYMDDGLKSLPTEEEAIDLLQAPLSEPNLRLHKIASNNAAVLSALPPQDCAKGIKDLNLGDEIMLIQRSLGLRWEITTDYTTKAKHTELCLLCDVSTKAIATVAFFAIRGAARQLRSDWRMNFIRASKELRFHKMAKEPVVQKYLGDHSCTWEFNPPHACGAWERMIGMFEGYWTPC
eukprot:superscaffoldBa00004744_g19384